MNNYRIIGIDLAKKNFSYAALNEENRVVHKASMSRDDFFEKLPKLFAQNSTFAFEACGGSHYVAQTLQELGHKVMILKPKDVKPYAKTRQKNDKNDSIAICKAALDPDLMRVHSKTKDEQEVTYLHKARQNVIQQRVQRSNSLITSLVEFGYVVYCGKSKFARECKEHINSALKRNLITKSIYEQMILDCEEIDHLMKRENSLDKEIVIKNNQSPAAQLLETIPGIGPINASILSIKPVGLYAAARDFSASLGLVPKQNTTGGNIQLGGITKQGDRYARTMLIQAGRSVVMRSYKKNPPKNDLYEFVDRLKKNNKHFNKIAVAVANKLARIAYACLTQGVVYTNNI